MWAKEVDDTMKSWIGATKVDLLLKWGPPTRTFTDGKDGEIYSYEYTNQTKGHAYTDKYGNTYYNAPQQYTIVRQFFINKDGIIYSYRWQGI
jgi:hypothetical protein